MTEVGFYHLLHWPLERALPKLLEKALERGRRAIVLAGSKARVDDLNSVLWTYEDRSWRLHGSSGDGSAVPTDKAYLADISPVAFKAAIFVAILHHRWNEFRQ